MTKVEIIKETVEYYSNNPRAIAGCNCSYFLNDGRRCAVGRCMYKNSARQFAELNPSASSIKDLEDHLLSKYRGHSPPFWHDLQILHDRNAYWKDQELTDDGKDYVKALIETYG